MELTFPLKGLSKGSPSSKQQRSTSRDLNNVRPYWNGRACGGQRPGMDKWSDDQIGDAEQPVVAMCSITTVS